MHKERKARKKNQQNSTLFMKRFLKSSSSIVTETAFLHKGADLSWSVSIKIYPKRKKRGDSLRLDLNPSVHDFSHNSSVTRETPLRSYQDPDSLLKRSYGHLSPSILHVCLPDLRTLARFSIDDWVVLPAMRGSSLVLWSASSI